VQEWLDLLYPAAIPCAPINDVAGALSEEHTLARNMRVTTEHPVFGTIDQLASPVKVGSEPPAYRRAPRRNEDFEHVLREIAGYDYTRISAAGAAGAFGPDHVVAPEETPDGVEAGEAASR
jgi:crotonobetainyl-CoA:carnitine CoA-transferase CaiB-like acyl-CoA transferase